MLLFLCFLFCFSFDGENISRQRLITFPITSKFVKNSPSATFVQLSPRCLVKRSVSCFIYCYSEFLLLHKETYTRDVALPKVVVLQWKHPLEKYRKGKGTFHSSFVRAMELTCQEHNPSMEIVKTKVFASKYVKLQRKIWRHDWSLQLYTT